MPQIDFAARRAWLDAELDAFEAAGTRIIVADHDGHPAGFITVDTARGVVDQLAVAPGAQGLGVASRLIDGAKVLVPEGLALVVNRDNATARRLYARHGFAPTGEGTNPVSGLPTVTMRWGPGEV